MSQRLLITSEPMDAKDTVYEAICWPAMSDEDIQNKLWQEWLCVSDSHFVGPWKIRIDTVQDFPFFSERIDPILDKLFAILGAKYPDCVWRFYHGDTSSPEHPTKSELNKWLSEFQ